ncbi:MAG TPA: methionine aminotransferase [Thermomicrobiales bacterium]|nr:methionine aminotransferase [Thermomicrobiales bacterium]
MSEPRSAQRLAGFGTTVFTEMSALAAEHGAINLGQGFPDFPGPDFVKEAAIEAIRADLNQYAPSHGLPRLREAIAADWATQHGVEVDPDAEVTVTSGATEALLSAMLALVNPGDEVIFFEPFYDSYVPQTVFAGGTPRVVPLQPPDWTFDHDALAAAFNERTRLFLLNTPHNPTGKVFSPQELKFIADLCIEHDVIVLADEVYERIVYDGSRHVPIATLPGMWERTLTINSTGKTFSVTGWKIGYVTGSAALQTALRTTHQFNVFATATPLQHGLAVALETAAEVGYYDQLKADYQERRDRLMAILGDAGLPPLPVQGSYFIMSDITGLGFANDVEFCRHLVTEVGVAAIPPSAFYLDPASAPLLARFCFAKQASTMEAAAERLQRLRA